MNVSNKLKFTVIIALVSLAGGLSFVRVDAQTKKKKSTKKTVAAKPTPKPLATPPMIGGAEIISRASDFQQQQQTQPILVDPAKPTVTDPPVVDNTGSKLSDLTKRVKKLENPKNDAEDKKKQLLVNLDILSKAESRADSLRKSLFDMIEKENSVKSRLDQIENDIRPEMIERQLQLSGSMRPEEYRDLRRKQLAAERTNLQALLTEIQNSRNNLTTNVQKADELVEKLRAITEKDIDENLKVEIKNP